MNNSYANLGEVAALIGEEPQMTHQAYYQLRLVYNLLNKIGEADIVKLGVWSANFGVLYALKHGRKLSSSDLSQSVLSGLSNLTSLIDRMERDGLVTRLHDEKDRRKTLLELTEEGERICQTVVPSHLDWIMKTMAVFSDNELEEFCRLLGILWTELVKQAEEADISYPHPRPLKPDISSSNHK